MPRLLRRRGPSTARPARARPLAGRPRPRRDHFFGARAARRPRAPRGAIRSRCTWRPRELRELLAQLLQLAVERIELTACGQSPCPNESLSLLPLLIEQRRRGIGKLGLQAAE